MSSHPAQVLLLALAMVLFVSFTASAQQPSDQPPGSPASTLATPSSDQGSGDSPATPEPFAYAREAVELLRCESRRDAVMQELTACLQAVPDPTANGNWIHPDAQNRILNMYADARMGLASLIALYIAMQDSNGAIVDQLSVPAFKGCLDKASLGLAEVERSCSASIPTSAGRDTFSCESIKAELNVCKANCVASYEGDIHGTCKACDELAYTAKSCSTPAPNASSPPQTAYDPFTAPKDASGKAASASAEQCQDRRDGVLREMAACLRAIPNPTQNANWLSSEKMQTVLDRYADMGMGLFALMMVASKASEVNGELALQYNVTFKGCLDTASSALASMRQICSAGPMQSGDARGLYCGAVQAEIGFCRLICVNSFFGLAQGSCKACDALEADNPSCSSSTKISLSSLTCKSERQRAQSCYNNCGELRRREDSLAHCRENCRMVETAEMAGCRPPRPTSAPPTTSATAALPPAARKPAAAPGRTQNAGVPNENAGSGPRRIESSSRDAGRSESRALGAGARSESRSESGTSNRSGSAGLPASAASSPSSVDRASSSSSFRSNDNSRMFNAPSNRDRPR